MVNTAPVEHKTLGIVDIFLDPENPRHDVVKGERAAIEAVINEQGPKLIELMRHIAEHGISPIDRLMVTKEGGHYVVVEGNRRICALKLLHNPDLSVGTVLARAVKGIAAGTTLPIHVDCAVAKSRDEARPWQILRHRGEAGGAGVIPWNTTASSRFDAKPGTQVYKAITFADAVLLAYPNNHTIQNAVAAILASRPTTLGRLVADPAFMTHLGLQDDQGHLVSIYPAAALERIVEQVLTDVATRLSVTQIKTKPQRVSYVASLPKPTPSTAQATPQPLVASTAAAKQAQKAKSQRRTKPASPFKEMHLQKFGGKIERILEEAKQLDLDRFPTASAVLMRALVELSVDQLIADKAWHRDREVWKRIRTVLNHLDPGGNELRFQPVRQGLQDNNNLFAVATLHAWVHNPHFFATPSDVRGIVSNYAPFVQAMNDFV